MSKTRSTGILCAAALLAVFLPMAPARAADMPPLAAAVSKGDLATVTLLLEQGADPDTVWEGYTVLTWAAQDGRFAIVKALVERHATVDPKVSDGKTPLRAAVDNRHADIVAYLLAHGAKVNVQSDLGWTPLDDIESGHDAKLAKLLRDHGAVNGLTPLLAAANRGDAAGVRQLLASGADPNSHAGGNMSAVFLAASSGSLAALKVLVEGHADLNAVSDTGTTPLMMAAVGGFKDVAAYLVAHGADLNVRNNAGLRALDVAMQYKQSGVAALLRASGAKDSSEITDADCTDFRHYADMGATTGYDSLAVGPADSGSLEETLGLRDANVSVGGGGCNVSDDGDTLICFWAKNNKNYQGMGDYRSLVTLAKGCSGDSKVTTTGGKTTVWYDRVAGKTILIDFDASEDSMTVTFGASQPL